MALSAVALCARALIKLGAAPIAAFEEPTIEAEIARNLYAPTRDALLSSHPWTFATAQAALPPLAAAPLADHAHAFQLPADFLRALSLGADARGRGLPYRIAERTLHADAEAAVLTYIFRPAEAACPPFFDHVLIGALAAEFCLPITESTSRAEALLRIAEDGLRRARAIDSQQTRPGRIEDFTLVEARS